VSPSPLASLDVERHLADPALKQRYVTTMFDLVAPSYDRFTRWFSYGMDRGWKADLVARARSALGKGGVVLDLACGTGDVAAELVGQGHRVIGVDPSPGMLALAARRHAGVELLRGDMLALPVPDGAATLATVAYGFRNTPDHRAALREVSRALAPGGTMVVLDFYRPASAVWSRVFLMYLSAAGGLYGWAWHRDPAAYSYIARSIAHYVTAAAFERDLGIAGFTVESVSRRLGGGICLHVARKR
jgi:demethylmenaquinone methyltransferase/2-methoxy-6-polyprenyl-1,4-benzoquinol methylase